LRQNLWNPEVRKRFLLRYPGEPDDAYNNRLRSSHLDNFVSPAITGHASILSEFSLADIPQSLEDNRTDVDLEGHSLEDFALSLDEDAIASDAMLVLVEFNEALGRPYLVSIPVSSVYSPLVGKIKGRLRIIRFSVKSTITLLDGKFGTKAVNQYRVYQADPARVQVWQESEEGLAPVGEELIFLGANKQPLGDIPVVWYSVSSAPLLQPIPPNILPLVELNLAYFNKASEIDTTETVTNLPTPYRKWPGQVPDEKPPLFLGTNAAIDLPEKGEVGFLEPTGSTLSIAHTRQMDRARQLERMSQQLISSGEIPKTATEALIEASQSRLTVGALAKRKQSVWQEIFKLWQRFADATYRYPDPVGTLTVSEAALKASATPEEVGQIFSGFTSGAYTRETMLEKLNQIGWLTDDQLQRELAAQAPPPIDGDGEEELG
jgi:hypothetical protein